MVPALQLSVADSGPGIPEAELESIFEKFIQSSTTKTGAGGTGLGLAICREIALLHAGEISASNRPVGGAQFTFLLPRKQLSLTDFNI
jgi:signal transduction histidine kinase